MLAGETPDLLPPDRPSVAGAAVVTDKEKKEAVMSKGKMFCFRLSEADYRKIQEKASKARLSMSAFILTSALGKEITVVEGLEEAFREMKAIGNNLNQLTALAHMGQIKEVGLVMTKRQLGAVWEAVTSLKAG
jgi:translation initiation factor 1 (eIF-1/SUI1)